MGYGSKTDSEGLEIRANGNAPILTGEQVKGNKITYFGMSTDSQTGETLSNRAEIKFLQSNGATFTYTFFDSDQDWAQDKVNKELLHICSKFVSKDEYYAALPGENITFTSFIGAIQEKIMPKAEGKTFTLKIIYRENKNNGKWYPQFPNFPNFIELDGTTPSTLSTNPKYDFYEIPTSNTEEELTSSTTGGDVF